MLNHKQCDAFLAVAETGSFEAAAIRLSITASAVTLRVQSLEKNLGHILIVRERPCYVTDAGRSLLNYLQHNRLREQDFLHHLTGQTQSFYTVNIATNADSLATWLLPSIKPCLTQHKIIAHFHVDDQSETHLLMQTGLVNACISAEPRAMQGCIAQPLGQMRYRLVANPEFVNTWFSQGLTREALTHAPAIIYNNKDQLHSNLLLQHFGLSPACYPHHIIPSSSAFAEAIFMGLGFGLVPDHQIEQRLKTGQLIDLMPKLNIEITLYWHHWKQQALALDQLTQHLLQHASENINGAIK